MACLICGGDGGFECPTCGTDFCEPHFTKHVNQKKSFFTISDVFVCERCGTVL